MLVKTRISNIVEIKKQVKDYQKPIRFTVTIFWRDEKGREQGFDIVGCLAGVGRDGNASWNGPMFWIGKKPAYSVHIAPGTYEDVLGALMKGGYFKASLEELIPDLSLKPVTAVEAFGLPNELEVTEDV